MRTTFFPIAKCEQGLLKFCVAISNHEQSNKKVRGRWRNKKERIFRLVRIWGHRNGGKCMLELCTQNMLYDRVIKMNWFLGIWTLFRTFCCWLQSLAVEIFAALAPIVQSPRVHRDSPPSTPPSTVLQFFLASFIILQMISCSPSDGVSSKYDGQMKNYEIDYLHVTDANDYLLAHMLNFWLPRIQDVRMGILVTEKGVSL